MSVQAFISCRFPVDDTTGNICEMLEPEISPYVSVEPKPGSLPQRLREKIGSADCLIVILSDKGSSAFVQNEVGIAFALGKPIFAIYEESVDVAGIQPYLSTFIKYNKEDVAASARDIASLKTAITQEIAVREISGAPDDILEQLADNGVLAIFPDRATAFRAFMRHWEREKTIRIVGSSIEGFKRGIGIEARELILPKLKADHECTIHIMLTHASFAQYREEPEGEPKGYIAEQIRTTTEMLEDIREHAKASERLKWRFFRGAPTCFMIMAGSFMLLNPYLYMQPAYFNFSMIVKETKSKFDIYNHYREYHFQRAWDHKRLCTDDPGLEDKKVPKTGYSN